MEVTKRTYQKHKTEKKISVKHYVNPDVKVFHKLGHSMYPVYVQVIYNKNNTKFRSKIPAIRHSESNFDIYTGKIAGGILDSEIEQDKKLITWLVQQKAEINFETFNISALPKIYHSQFYELSYFVEWCLKEEISEKLDDINKSIVSQNFTNFHIFEKTSAFTNLEFYAKKYPQLYDLKEKYSSQIWFFNIYIESIRDFNILVTNPITGSEHISYYTSTYALAPAIHEFKDHFFQKKFPPFFIDMGSSANIMDDLDKLIQKYYDIFIYNFILK